MDRLPILFRTERSGDAKGEVTAVFPTLPGTGPYDFTVYAHVGQHGTGGFEWYWATRPARPAEYADLLAELRGIYTERPASAPDIYGEPVELIVRQRFPRNAFAARRAACERN